MQLMIQIRASGNPALRDEIVSDIEALLRKKLDERLDGVSLFIGEVSGQYQLAFGLGRNLEGTDLQQLTKQQAARYGVSSR